MANLQINKEKKVKNIQMNNNANLSINDYVIICNK